MSNYAIFGYVGLGIVIGFVLGMLFFGLCFYLNVLDINQQRRQLDALRDKVTSKSKELVNFHKQRLNEYTVEHTKACKLFIDTIEELKPFADSNTRISLEATVEKLNQSISECIMV